MSDDGEQVLSGEHSLEEIVELMSDAVISIDSNHRIVRANPATERIFDYAIDELLGMDLDQLLPESAKEHHRFHVEEFRQSKTISRLMNVRARIYGCARDDRLVPLEISILKHPDGGQSIFTAICRDASRRVDAEEKIRKSEARLAQAQHMASLGNWEWNLETNELIWSDEIYHILGLEEGGSVVSRETFLDRVHPDDRDLVRDTFQNGAQDAAPVSIRHRIITPDGVEKVVSELIEADQNSDGEISIVRGTLQDITTAWLREMDLLHQTRKAEEANEVKGQFLTTMSHELRTPLNAIVGLGEVLELSLQNQDVKQRDLRNIGLIRESGDHLLSLVEDVLDVSRIEQGSLDFMPEAVSGDALIATCTGMVAEKAAEKNIEIATEVQDDLPVVSLDPRSSRQILLNLLTNAIKFSKPDGKVWLRMKYDQTSITWEVEDEGVGISKEDIEKVFEPFTQRDMSTTRNHEGIGLGLTIVKSLVEMQGGSIRLKSDPGVGTCISVTFPLSVSR